MALPTDHAPAAPEPEEELDPHEPDMSADDPEDPADADEAPEHPRRLAARSRRPEPRPTAAATVEPRQKTHLDLATLASLVQWTHRVVEETGPEYAEKLFEISEMTGRLSSDLQQVLLAVVRLRGAEASESTDFATKAVMLIAQLDGLLGNTTQKDARMLPFLLRGDLEVLSLIQRERR